MPLRPPPPSTTVRRRGLIDHSPAHLHLCCCCCCVLHNSSAQHDMLRTHSGFRSHHPVQRRAGRANLGLTDNGCAPALHSLSAGSEDAQLRVSLGSLPARAGAKQRPITGSHCLINHLRSPGTILGELSRRATGHQTLAIITHVHRYFRASQ